MQHQEKTSRISRHVMGKKVTTSSENGKIEGKRHGDQKRITILDGLAAHL